MECIALRHQPGAERSIEATLLRDADVLDFLGTVGVLRDFSKNARDLRGAYEIVHKRRETLPGMLVIDKAKGIAARHIQEMDELLSRFEEDSFGCY